MGKLKDPICKLCREGHRPKILSNGSVEHWIVKSIFPARISIKTCKEPEAARLALASSPASSDEG